MTVEQIFTLLALVLAPLSGIIVAIVVDRRSKLNTKVNTSVAEKSVDITEREARNHEIAMIIDGFTESLANLRTDLTSTKSDLSATKDELKMTREELGMTRKELGQAREDHQSLVDRHDMERLEVMQHISALEALVPNPPGPPTRPKWLT